MKATGIIRRIDDLGRVVIPKEIRRIMRITEGDPLELFTEDGGLVLRKYSPMDKMQEVTDKYIKMLSKEFSGEAEFCITDTDYLLAASGRGDIQRLVNSELEMEFVAELRKRNVSMREMKFISGSDIKTKLIYPIVCEGDLYGSLIVHTIKLGDTSKLDFGCRTIVNFIQSELE